MLKPMLASLTEAPLDDPAFVYEPKYDGIRAIAEVAPGGPVRLWSRLGNEKTSQFPEIARALTAWAKHLDAPVVLDGEIVALDARGEPAGFQNLQGRIHVAGEQQPAPGSVAYILFDLLRDGGRDLRERPLVERRAALEQLFAHRSRRPTAQLRLSEVARGDGRAMYQRALDSGWEGVIAKVAASKYRSGKRSPDWRKLKIVQEQEFVVGGWTEPRQSRTYFGALLLGVYEGDRLIYSGHTGTGFDEKELARVMKRLKPLEARECPFETRPKTNEKAHWVRPALVAQVRFTEWTADGKLRHPVYLGLRDDKKPEDVHRERSATVSDVSSARLAAGTARRTSTARSSRSRRTKADDADDAPGSADRSALIEHLHELERAKRDGVLALPDGGRVSVSNLHKVFWPEAKLTKGDLLRYYVEIAPVILPVVADRPLVMKRLPNGIHGKAFYQQRAPDEVPAGVRVETVSTDAEVPSRLVGGSLVTLLYMAQLAAISQDPWFSRVQSPGDADFCAIDLDPPPGVPFERVLDVARWVRDELDAIGAIGAPKTSGADGLHVYVPLPPGTPYEAGLIFCQIVATVVAQKHPKIATVERNVRARGDRIYVDYLQNIGGKTLACAYSARASDYAGVSTPLTWTEVDAGVRREDFTIRTVPGRVRQVGDLWRTLRESKGIDLSDIERYASRHQ
jgi:bifunctional non-homologous end joining protein LigD